MTEDVKENTQTVDRGAVLFYRRWGHSSYDGQPEAMFKLLL